MFRKAAPWLRALFIITALVVTQVPIAVASDSAPIPAAPLLDEKAPDDEGGEAFPPTPRKGCALRINGVALDGTLPANKPDKADGPPYFGILADILDDWSAGLPAYPGPDHRSGDVLTWIVLVQNSTASDCTTGAETLSMVQAEVVIEGNAPVMTPLTYPDGNPGILEPGELAYSVVTIEVPPNVNGTMDIVTAAAAEDEVGYPGIPPNDTIDVDEDNIPILGPGFSIVSFTPSVTEASPGQFVDFALTIQNTRPSNVIAGIEITSSSSAFAACTDLDLTTAPNPWTLTEVGTPNGIFEVNETAVCNITGVPIPNNPAPETYQLSGSIRAIDTGGESLTLQAASNPPIVVNLPDVGITKVVKQITRGGPGNVVPPPAAIGDQITYTITVTNTGKLELHDIFIIDSLTGPVYLPLGTTLAVGASLTIDTTHYVMAGGQDPLVNKVTVTARATGFPDQVDAEASAIVDIVDSALKVELTAEDPATGDPISKVAVGDTVRYRMVIRNEGGLEISGINYATLTPPLKTVGTPPAIQPSSLPAGGQLPAFTWDYVILATDEDPLTSTVRIRGTDSQGVLLRAQSQTTVDIATPGLSIDATVLEPPTSTVLRGGEAVYLVEITNTDTVTSLCGITLNQYKRDPDGGPDMPVTLGVPLTWPLGGTPGQLGPGETATAITTYLVTGEDKDPLQMMFEALSTGPCTGGEPLVDRTIRVLDVSDVQVNVELVPDLGGDGVAQIGEDVEFTFLAQNVGSVTLENLSAVYCIYHTGAPTPACDQPFSLSATSLGALEPPVTGTFVRTITQADAEAVPFLAEVTMFGRDNQGNDVAIKAATTLTVATEDLIFTLDGPQQAVIGDTENFGYIIGNETEMVLHNVRIYNMLVEDAGDPYGYQQVGYYDSIPVPLSGQVTTGSYDYTILPGVGINGGVLTMQARLLADTDLGPIIGTASFQVQIIPMVQVIKEGDGTAVAGTAVHYNITIINNSNDQNLTVTGYEDQVLSGYGVTITNSDFNPWPENPPGSGTSTPGVLPPGTSVSGSFEIPAVNDTPNPLVNVFTVTGTRSSDGAVVSGSDDHRVSLQCPLGVFFTVTNLDDDPDDTLGELLEWRITVTNQSFDTIDNIQIFEQLRWNNVAVPYSEITWTSGIEGTLGPGQSAILNTFTQQVTNVFFLTGTSSMNDMVRLEFSSPTGVSGCPAVNYVYPLYSPIGIIKVPDPIIAFTGDTVNYTLFMWSTTEENDGVYANYDVTAYDSLLQPNPIPFDYDHNGTIEPSETRGWVHPNDELINVLPYVIRDSDPPELYNTVRIEFPDPTDPSVLLYTTYTALVFTGKPLAITKTPSTDLAVPGTTITYDYTITNLSPYPIEDITITDTLIGELVPALTGGTLSLAPYAGVAPDALRDVEYLIPLTAPDPLVNTVDVQGWIVLPDLSRREINVSLTVAVDLRDSELQVVKSVYADDPANPGHPGDPLPDTFPANPDGIPEANVGQEVHYCFNVSNTSGASTWVENIRITDSLFPTALQIPFEAAVTAKYGNIPADMLIGQQSVDFCYGPIPLQTTMGDPVENVVSVTGTASGGYDVFTTDTLLVDLRGTNLLITKAPSQPLAYVGDEISYTIYIQNLNTTTAITNIQVTDLIGTGGAPLPIPIDAFDWSNSNVDPITPGTLGPNGGFASYTYFYTIKPTDPSLLSNTATAVGELDNGAVPPEVVQDSTRATVGVTASQLLVYKTATPDVARPGDTVRYTISILNVGTTPVYDITAVDEAYGVQRTFSGSDLTDATLDPLETAFVYYDVVMPTAAQILSQPEYDPYINTITVQGTILDSHGDPLPEPVVATATESVDILQPDIRIVKSPTIGAATPGMNVAYNITISNRGGPDETLTGLIFRDLTGGVTINLAAVCPEPTTCPFTYSDQPVADWDNDPGTPNTTNPRGGEYYDPTTGLLYLEQMQGQVTVQVPDDFVGSQFTNVVEITGQNVDTSEPVQDRASATIDIRDDGINVEKTSSVTAAPVGTPVTYTVTVTNVGDNPIERLVLADAAMPGGSMTVEDGFPNSPEDEIPGDDSGTLDPGEVYETTYIHTLTVSDGDPYVNQVVVTGYTLTSAVVNVAEATVDIQTASIGVEKFVCAGVETGIDPGNGDDGDPSTLLQPCLTFVNVGDAFPDQVTYYVHIMNTGPLPVQNLALTDSRVTPPALPQTTLAVGEGLWIMYTYTVQPSDPDPVVNTVTASAQASVGGAVQARASAALSLVTGDIQLTKTAVDQAVVGDTVTYTLTVSHVNPASGTAVTNIQVVDPLSPQGTSPLCTIPSLGWGDTPVECTFDHTITLADGATLVNTATATGSVEVSPGVFASVSDTASHEVQIVTPGLSVTKTANVSVASIGETITYTYTVTNTGTVNLENLSVTDSDPAITFAADPWPTYLPPSGTATRTATHVVSASDPDPLVNIVTVTGRVGTTTLTTTATETVFIANGSLVVSNTPNVAYARPGDSVTFTYTARNVGTEALDSLAVVDTICGDLSASLPVTTLQPGMSATVYCTTTAALPGPVISTVYAQAQEPGPVTVSDTATAEVPVTEGGLLVTKAADVTVASPGDTIHYTVEITNIGTEALDISSIEDLTVALDPPYPTTLGPGERATLHGTFIVPVASPPSSVANTVTVSAVGQQTGATFQDSASAAVAILEIPGARLALFKEVSVTRALPGEMVTYTFRIQNVSATAVNNITLSDPMLGAAIPVDPLAPGNATTIVRTVTIPGDWSQPTYPNTATVLSNSVAEDTATVNLLVEVVSLAKAGSPDPAAPGGTITYTFTITNNSSEPVSGVTITDPGVTFGTAPTDMTIPVGGSQVTGTVILPLAYTDTTYENTAQLSVGGVVVDTVTEVVAVTQSGYEVEILSIQQNEGGTLLDLIQTGEPAEITYQLRNTGTENITGLGTTVTVSTGGTCTTTSGPLPTTLVPGGLVTVTCDYTPPVNPSSLTPTVTVDATGSIGATAVTASDDSTMPLVDLALLVEVIFDPAAPAVGDTITYTFRLTNQGQSPLGCSNADVPDTSAPCHLAITSTDAGLNTLLAPLANSIANTVLAPGATSPAFTTASGTAAPFTATATGGYYTAALATANLLAFYTVEDQVSSPAEWSGLVIDGQSVRQEDMGAILIPPNPFQTGEPIEVSFTLSNVGAVAITNLAYEVTFDIPDAPAGLTCEHEGTALPDTLAIGGNVVVVCNYTPMPGLASYRAAGGLDVDVTIQASGTAGADDIVVTAPVIPITLVDLLLEVEFVINSPSDDASTTNVIETLPGDIVAFTLRLTNNGASPIGCDGTVAADAECHLHMQASAETTGGIDLNAAFAAMETQIANRVLAVGEQPAQFMVQYTVKDTDQSSRYLVGMEGGYYTAALLAANLLQHYVLVPQENSYQTVLVEVGGPELTVALQVIPNPPVYGQAISYNVSVTNTGATTLTGLTAQWTITPLAGTYAPAISDDGIMLVGGLSHPRLQTLQGTFTLTATNLAPGASATGTYAKVEDQTRSYVFSVVAANGTVTVTDSVDITLSPTGVPGSGTGTPTSTVDPTTLDPTKTEPEVTKTASATTAQPGSAITWTITVRNSHTSAMTNVTIQDSVPGGMTVDSATTSRGVSVVDGSLVTVTTGQMNPGDTVTLTINTTVNADAASPGEITNTACAQREGGGQQCDSATVSLGPDVGGLPSTGVQGSSGLPGGVLGIALVLLLLSVQVSRRRMWIATVFVVAILVIAVGGVLLLTLGGDDDTKEPTDKVEATDVPPADQTPEASPPVGPGVMLEFPPTATPYVLPTPAGPRTLLIPKLADQFPSPIPIVELPIVNRQWDISGLGFYVGWLEGTTWMDPQWGNTVLAAHVQLGARNPGPFWALDQLQPGDEIIVYEGSVERRFTVRSTTKVDPNDWTVTAPTSGPTLTLITCTEWSQAYGVFSQRLVVQAVPMES